MAGSKELNKYLKELSRKDLIKEVTKLYSRFKFVRDYYQSELGSDNGELLEKYKKQMHRIFYGQGLLFKSRYRSFK